MIRDIKCSPSKGSKLVMTASLDKTVKIVNIETNNTVTTMNLEQPCWSCEWADENIVFCAQQKHLLIYDLRKPSVCVSKLSPPGNYSANIHSIYYVPDYKSPFSSQGVVSASSQGAQFWNGKKNYEVSSLNLEGDCFSLHYDLESNLFLSSFRKTQTFTKAPSHSVLFELS